MRLKSIWVWDKIDSIETLLSNIADGVIVTDAQGKIVIFNPAAEKIFGLNREKTGQTTGHRRLDSLIKQSIAGKQFKEELTFNQPRRRVIKVKTAPLKNRQGEIAGAVAILDDVTKVRNLEKMREEFIANVSHELRTPISAIRVSTEALLNGARDDPKASKLFLENIFKESKRLSLLVADILDLSRLESDNAPYRKDNISLAKVINQISHKFQPKSIEKRIELVVKNNPSLKLTINRDDFVLAFGNLLDNALKYTLPGGKILVESERANGKISVHISDTGIGIPRQDISRIFERFYRVNKDRSRESGGTGLGLSIVKHVVERHRGEVKVESILGKGSKFTILLPS